MHFLRNALDRLPPKADDDSLQELCWMYDRRDLAEVRHDLAQWLARWQAKYPKLCTWGGDNIEQMLTSYRLPHAHHKRLKSTNMLERLNEEIKRRTRVVDAFPDGQSCLNLAAAPLRHIAATKGSTRKYMNMAPLHAAKTGAYGAVVA